MVDIYMYKLNDKFNIDIDSICLSDTIRRKANSIGNYHNVKTVYQSVIGEILARISICRRLEYKNDDVVLYRNEHKKPLFQEQSNFFFNISHSGEWVVCASDFQLLGIDIEQIKQIDYKVGELIFSPVEYEMFNSKDDYEKELWFYKFWTMKESYVKAIGTGLTSKLSKFTIKTKNQIDFYVDENSNYPKAYFRQFRVGPSYIMTLCSFSEVKTIKIYDVSDTINELIGRLNTPTELQDYINEKLKFKTKI